MSIELLRVLQRIRVVDFDEHGELRLRRLGVGVRAMLGELGLAAERDREHEPLRISARQLARRAGRDETEAKAIRRAMKKAISLGLVQRLLPEGELGSRAAWPVLLHPALIAAARQPRPWEGPPILFPRDWEECAPEQVPTRFVTLVVEMAPLVEMNGRKETEKDHYPPSVPAPSVVPLIPSLPPTRPEAVGLSGPVARGQAAGSSSGAASARGGSGSGTRKSLGQGAMRKGREEQFASRSESLAALKRWLDLERQLFADRVAMAMARAEPAVPGLEEFCAWLEASASAAGWLAKQAGAWPGAVAGDLAFALERRSVRSGKRGGTFVLGNSANYHRVSLCSVLAGARSELVDAAVVQAAMKAKAKARGKTTVGSIEAVFMPLGDHALLLVDDLDEAALEQFAGWSGVAIVETSPGNYQAMLMAPRVLRGDEVRAAQSALCRRAGLALEAIQANQPRRFPGSVNRKPELGSEPFVTRLVGTPRVGTIPAEELAALLAENAAAKASKAVTRVSVPRKQEAVRQAGRQQVRPRETTDQSDSGKDWEWGMKRFRQFPPPSRAIVVEELVARVAARGGRQGKRTDHPDYLRYAEDTVANLQKEIQARRSL